MCIWSLFLSEKDLYFSVILHVIWGRFTIKLIKLKLQGTSPTRAPSTALGGAPVMPQKCPEILAFTYEGNLTKLLQI